MSVQPEPHGPQRAEPAEAEACPSWCARHDNRHEFREDRHDVHVSGLLVVKHTALRLASSMDPVTGVTDGPLVYIGDEEYTLYEAEVLIDVLTHLVDEGTGRTEVTRPSATTSPRQHSAST
jgi:hypothetical protein